MNRQEVEALVMDLAPVVKEQLDGLRAQVAALEGEVKALGETTRYRGVWSAAAGDYRRGQTSTSSGALWHCNKDGTTERPGKGSDWTLMAKSEGR